MSLERKAADAEQFRATHPDNHFLRYDQTHFSKAGCRADNRRRGKRHPRPHGGVSLSQIGFNRPAMPETAYQYLREAVRNMHLSGDGPFTKRMAGEALAGSFEIVGFWYE